MKREFYILTMIALGCFMMAGGIRAHDGEGWTSFAFVLLGLALTWSASRRMPK